MYQTAIPRNFLKDYAGFSDTNAGTSGDNSGNSKPPDYYAPGSMGNHPALRGFYGTILFGVLRSDDPASPTYGTSVTVGETEYLDDNVAPGDPNFQPSAVENDLPPADTFNQDLWGNPVSLGSSGFGSPEWQQQAQALHNYIYSPSNANDTFLGQANLALAQNAGAGVAMTLQATFDIINAPAQLTLAVLSGANQLLNAAVSPQTQQQLMLLQPELAVLRIPTAFEAFAGTQQFIAPTNASTNSRILLMRLLEAIDDGTILGKLPNPSTATAPGTADEIVKVVGPKQVNGKGKYGSELQ